MTNKSLYRICLEKPLSIEIVSARWGLFGHTLRRDKDIPANKARELILYLMVGGAVAQSVERATPGEEVVGRPLRTCWVGVSKIM